MLYQHQLDGAAWLSSRTTGRGYLADAPGLGKTRTAIRAARAAGAQRPLVVCPAIVRTHWHREGFVDAEAFGGEDFPVKSYDEIVRGGIPLMKRLFLEEKIDALVLDEAHFIKHATSKRTQILLGKNGYARRLAHVFPLSGTPVPKNPFEFWTILSALFPEVAVEHGIKTGDDFKARFCTTRGSFVRGQYREKILAVVNNKEEFQAILDKVMLRRTLDDVGLDVPTLHWQTTRLDGGRAELDWETFQSGKHAVRDVESALLENVLADIENDPHVARMRRRLGELKVAPVAEMLQAQLAESDEKICVFAHHTSVLDALREELREFGVAFIDGGTGPRMRDIEIQRFATEATCRVFIGQNQACGTGTDGLQKSGARRMVLVEPSWSAYENQQLGKRLARIGGEGRVVAQMVALAGTLDEAIVQQNHREVEMADAIGLGEK